jgi:hypothetical protein
MPIPRILQAVIFLDEQQGFAKTWHLPLDQKTFSGISAAKGLRVLKI